MSKFYVGQRVVDGYGVFGEVISIDSESVKYPIIVKFKDAECYFAEDGVFNLIDKKSVRSNIYPVVEGQPTPVKMPEDEKGFYVGQRIREVVIDMDRSWHVDGVITAIENTGDKPIKFARDDGQLSESTLDGIAEVGYSHIEPSHEPHKNSEYNLIMKNKQLTSWDYSFTVNLVRTLTDTEKKFFEQCVGYSNSKNIRGEEASFEWNKIPLLGSQSKECVEVHIDTTKSRRDDVGDGFADFWDDILTYLDKGSPVRKDKTRLFSSPFYNFDMSTLIDGVESDDAGEVNEKMLTKLQGLEETVELHGKTYKISEIVLKVKPIPQDFVYGGVYEDVLGKQYLVVNSLLERDLKCAMFVSLPEYQLAYSISLNKIDFSHYKYIGHITEVKL